MADTKVSALTALTGANLANGDLFYVVDVSAGTAGSKSITYAEIKTVLQPYSANLATLASGVSGGTLSLTVGGTGLSSCTTGDLLIGTGANALGRLAAGSSNNVLAVSGGSPAWTNALSVATLSASGQITSTVGTGTAPFVVASTTEVANLNAARLQGSAASAFATASHTHSAGDITTGTAAGPIFITTSVDESPLVTKAYGVSSYAASFRNSSNVEKAYILGNGQIVGDMLRALTVTGAPLLIASTTACTNLNADLVDGYHATDFASSTHSHTLTDIGVGTGAGVGFGFSAGSSTSSAAVLNIQGGTVGKAIETFDETNTSRFSVSTYGLVVGRTFNSSVASGTAPLVINSTTACTNLNADLLDGSHAAAFAAASHTHGLSALTGDTFSAGQLIAGTGAGGLLSKLNLGTTGQVLTATSGTGLTWASPAVRMMSLTCVDYTTDVTVGDGAGYMVIQAPYAGLNLTAVHAYVITAGTTGTTDIQIARIRSGTPADMLSTKITIDSTENGSDTAATAAVINGANDDVLANDIIRIDVDAVSTTKPKGLIVTLNFA